VSRSGTAELLRTLDRSFQPLRRDFENHAGKARLVAVVSPSCGKCLDGVDALHASFLPRVKSEDLLVMIVWASLMPTDVTPKIVTLAERYADPRLIHYWDDSGRIARAFAAALGLAPGQSVNNVFLLYGPDDTWDPDRTMDQEPADHNALLAGWRPGPWRLRMGEHRAVQMSAFDLNALERAVEALLAVDSTDPAP